ncbi:MAG TPA: flagellar basal body-associated FliL family protein [Kineosporiaceae bacterium]|nr:flagellar basal body-associated FliL family protein [Kineosporiaceae bacterium]
MTSRTEAEAKSGEAEEASGGGGKKKLLLIAGPLVLVIAAAAVYFLFLKGGSSSAPKKVVHNPGAVVKLDPITINLAGGHFLKLGIALQPEAGATELDGSKALDVAIELFSNRAITELSTTEGRDKLKAELVEKVSEAYEKKVYDVYFTEFVYQ